MIQLNLYHLLLVEDDAAQAFLATKLLESSAEGRFDIQHVTTLAEAMERLDGQTYDLVLLDLGLPDAFGLQGVQRLCADRPNQPFAVLTAAGEPNMARAAIKLGAEDYIVKDRLRGETFARSVLHNIDRHRARLRLRRNAEDIATLVGAMADGVLVVDGNGQILYANGAAAAFHCTEATLMHGELFEHDVGEGGCREVDFGAGGGRARVQMRATPLIWRDRDVHVIVIRDINAGRADASAGKENT